MFVHRLVVLTFGNHGEPHSGIASLTMYDVTVFTFGKKVMDVTEFKETIYSEITMKTVLY